MAKIPGLQPWLQIGGLYQNGRINCKIGQNEGLGMANVSQWVVTHCLTMRIFTQTISFIDWSKAFDTLQLWQKQAEDAHTFSDECPGPTNCI